VIRPKSEKHFWILGVVILRPVILWTYFPALLGKVPLPIEMVSQFPAWHSAPPGWHYADIGDLVTAFYPFRALSSKAVHSGTLPLWNPYFLGGAPFLANPQSSLFYLPNFLYYVFSLPTAWMLCLMLRVFLAGMFMTLFVRSIGGSKAGSILSGIVFSLCGFMTAWQGQPMADAATWLPLTCYSILRLRNDPSRISMAIASIAFAMPVLAGHPETAAHVTFVAIAFALLTFARPSFDVHFLLRFTVCGLLAIGLSAIQVLPTLEWISLMQKDRLTILWPPLELHAAYGWVSRDMLRGQTSAGVWIPEGAAYVGMITLLLAPVGFLHRSKRYAVFFAGLVVVGVCLAYGIQPLQWLSSHTPVLAGLKNWRLIFAASFGLAALAGLGLTVLEESSWRERQRLMAIGLIAVSFILVFAFYYSLRNATQFRVEFTRRPSFSRAMLFAGMIPLIWRLISARSRRGFAILACAVTAFDLLTFSYGFTGFSKREDIFPGVPVIRFLSEQTDHGQWRLALLGTPYPMNANLMYGLPSADGYEVGMVAAQRLFSLDYTDNRLDGIGFNVEHLLSFNDRRLDLLNVKYLSTTSVGKEFDLLKASSRFQSVYNDGHVAVFENTSVLPRAFLVPQTGIELLKDADSQLAALRDPAFDPQKTVIVSNRPPSLSNLSVTSTPQQAASSFVKITGSGVNDVSIRASAGEASVLVVSQTYYPGWKAIVDGKPSELFPVNMTLTGVPVQPGAHDVRLVFDPVSFKVGAGLTLLTVVIIIAGLVAVRRSTNDETLVAPNPVITA
jgi:membrane protein YfhO